MRLLFLAALVVALPSASARAEQTQRAKQAVDNPEMAALFEADQNIRANLKPAQFADRAFLTQMLQQDAARRVATKRLLDDGKLATGNDFYAAAFVFQHGSGADDYLLAHSLAVVAVARGKPDASWIAAATLDRYLQKIGQKQIYGTQFLSSKETGATMEPYDRTLASDQLRAALNVPPLAEQDKRLETMKAAMPRPK